MITLEVIVAALGVLSVVLLALIAAAPALSYPIRVNFTALGDPTDPVLAGVTSTGFFAFDSSIIPYGGGQVWASEPPGLAISSVSFDWDGHGWTAADVTCGTLTFEADGALIGWNLQAKASPGYVVGGTTDFSFGISPSGSSTFSYASPRIVGVQAGSLVTWDAQTLPIIVGAWISGDEQLALDSFGRVYTFSDPGVGSLGTVTIVGNLFGGPPPSRVINLIVGGGNTVFATLENGDIWHMSPPADGALLGNIFSAPGIAGVQTTSASVVNVFSPNRPNPFNPVTKIPYTLAGGGRVTIKVFDVAGRLVRTVEDSIRPGGQYVAQWDGRDDHGRQLSSGTYFGRITFPDGNHSERKLTIVR